MYYKFIIKDVTKPTKIKIFYYYVNTTMQVPIQYFIVL